MAVFDNGSMRWSSYYDLLRIDQGKNIDVHVELNSSLKAKHCPHCFWTHIRSKERYRAKVVHSKFFRLLVSSKVNITQGSLLKWFVSITVTVFAQGPSLATRVWERLPWAVFTLNSHVVRRMKGYIMEEAGVLGFEWNAQRQRLASYCVWWAI